MPKQDIIPRTETVQEIGSKCEVPSLEEFLKNYEFDEEVVDIQQIKLFLFSSDYF